MTVIGKEIVIVADAEKIVPDIKVREGKKISSHIK